MMWGAIRELIRFHERSSVKMKTMLGLVTAAVLTVDSGEVALELLLLHETASNAAATSAIAADAAGHRPAPRLGGLRTAPVCERLATTSRSKALGPSAAWADGVIRL
jgi:hypothetical protein